MVSEFMLTVLSIIWLEMEMICSQVIAQVQFTGEIKTPVEVAHFGLKVSHIKTGNSLEKGQECKLLLFLTVQMISIVLAH